MGENPVRSVSNTGPGTLSLLPNEEQMAQSIFSRIGYTDTANVKGISSYNGVLVLKAGKQPEIMPAYRAAAVKKVQVVLKALGLLPQNFKADGVYSKETQKAVKKFQDMVGAVGSAKGDVIGKHTLDALLRAYKVCKGNGDLQSWQGKLIYVATGVELDPLETPVAGNPPNVEEMLIYMINQSEHLKETREGRAAIYYQPEGITQATKILKAALWIIGLDQIGAAKVYTQDILGILTKSAGGGYAATVGPKALNVISRALTAAHEATVKGLDPYERAEYIKKQVKGVWGIE